MNTKDDFYEQVYQVVSKIPFGRVTSYGAIANFLGSRNGARLVGYALKSAKDHVPLLPAHRVVNRNGLLTGMTQFAPGMMEELLLSEGIKVSNNQVVEFEKHFWSPETLL